MTNALIWYGRLTTMSRLRAIGWALVGAAILWLLLLLVIPCLVLAVIAFTGRDADGQIVWSLSFDNFKRLAGFGIFGWSADILRIFWRSTWVAGVVTIVCLLLAYPLAFFIAGSGPRWRRLWLTLIIVPLCTNIVVRTYAWKLLLSHELPPAQIAGWLGLIGQGDDLYPSVFAVIIGMVSCSLPFAVLPIYTSIERMDWSLVEAASDLYASGWRLFRSAILPQTFPGAVVAVIFTFVPAMGMFVVSDRLGGGKVTLIGNLIQQQFGESRDYPFGSAVCLVLIVLTLLGLYVYRRVGRGVEIL